MKEANWVTRYLTQTFVYFKDDAKKHSASSVVLALQTPGAKEREGGDML
jgi:hypothetical protein